MDLLQSIIDGMATGDYLVVLVGVLMGLALVGTVVAKFTATSKDDAFFARLLEAMKRVVVKPKDHK